MMLRELEIRIGSESSRVFLQRGFFGGVSPTAHFHNHNYTEIHLLSGGGAVFWVEGKTLTVPSGGLLAIPSRCFHACLSAEDGAGHTAFQIEETLAEAVVRTLPAGLVAAFLEEIEAFSCREDYTRIEAYLGLIASFLHTAPPTAPRRIADNAFLIHEFFSLHYKEDVRLSDLAHALHLSERQSERLVLAHTGRTFRGELTHTRLTVAEQLMKHSGLSLTEIACAVGYETYGCFWKARRKYRGEK